jgi:hypothetical protein
LIEGQFPYEGWFILGDWIRVIKSLQ